MLCNGDFNCNKAYVMFTLAKCLIVFIWVGFGKFGKLGFDCLEKDDQTDCKFICGVADEDIMKSET